MNTIIRALICSLLICLSLASHSAGILKILETAIETESITVSLDKSGRGEISVLPCSKCTVKRSKISGPEQVRVQINGKPAAFERLFERNGQPATVIYNADTDEVVRIIW